MRNIKLHLITDAHITNDFTVKLLFLVSSEVCHCTYGPAIETRQRTCSTVGSCTETTTTLHQLVSY